jgi:Uma2 family endonuclease
MPEAARYELVNGQLVERVVSMESSRFGGRIVFLLSLEAERTSECDIYGSDLGYRCFPFDPDLIRKPDASAIRKDRVASLGGDRGYSPISADLAVEVISPNELYHDVMEKVEEYLQGGFRTVWVVEPSLKAVTIYHLEGGIEYLHENDTITGAAALPGFCARVGDLFRA